MLQLIRDRFTGVVAFLVIGAIGVTLVISFGNMDQGGVAGTYAAEVNGEEVDMRLFRRVVQNQLIEQQEAFQGDLPELIQQQIQRNVLEGLVRNKIVTQYVRDVGFRIDDTRLSMLIGSQPVFQVAGEFSREAYVAVLASQGVSPERFESDQRAQMEVAQLEDAIVSSAFYTPTQFRRYIELLAEQRQAAFILLEPAKLADDLVIADEELTAYYDINPDEFRTQETVRLEYVELRMDEIVPQVSVDEQEIRDYYEARAESFVAAEQRQSRHILIATDEDTDVTAAEKKAEELRQRLDNGETFDALAREFSDDPVSAELGGDLGWAGRGDFAAAFEEALFALAEGETSAPVRTEFGYHIIRLDAVNVGSLQTFDDVRDELVEELTKQKIADRFYALAEQVDDLALENPTGLEAVASETGLEVRTIEDFSRNGGPPFGYNAALVDAAFNIAVLEDGENSPLIEIGDDSAIVLRVAEHRPSVVQPFDAVRDRVEASVRLQKAGQLARDRGAQILQRLEAGDSLDAVAQAFDVEMQAPGMLNRNSSDVSPELLAGIFRAPRPVGTAPVYREALLADGGYAVFRLDRVEPGRADLVPQDARDQRKRMLARQGGNNEIAALVAELRADAKVIVAPGLFDQPEIN